MDKLKAKMLTTSGFRSVGAYIRDIIIQHLNAKKRN